MRRKDDQMRLAREGIRTHGSNDPHGRTQAAVVGLGLMYETILAKVILIGESAKDGSRGQTLLGTCYGLRRGTVIYEPHTVGDEPWGQRYSGFLVRARRRQRNVLYTLQNFDTWRCPPRIVLARTDQLGTAEAAAFEKAGYAHTASILSEPGRRWDFGIPAVTWETLKTHIFPLLAPQRRAKAR